MCVLLNSFTNTVTHSGLRERVGGEGKDFYVYTNNQTTFRGWSGEGSWIPHPKGHLLDQVTLLSYTAIDSQGDESSVERPFQYWTHYRI